MKKRPLAFVTALCLLCASLAVPASAAEPDAAALQTIQALGIMKGDEDGDLMLDSPVTRAQFVTMMIRASSYKDSVSAAGSGYSLFKDVKSSHWASAYIRIALQEGWMTGFTDGTFRPDRSISLEEACTALLRLLGYDSSALTGSYPAAQLNKAHTLGLRDQLDAGPGEALKRRDCVQLFCNLLTAKNSSGQVYAAALGHTVTNGELDYAALVRGDLCGPYVAGGGDELPFTPMTVYRDEEKTSSAALEPYDVYYYHENLKTVWIYTEHVTGVITALSPSASAPTSVTVAGKTYSIGTTSAAWQLSALDGDPTDTMVTLLLGMDGVVVDILTGEQADMRYYDADDVSVVYADLSDPHVASGGDPLPFTPAVIYRNGERSDSAALEPYDVYYYHEGLRTVWIYTERVAGKITALSPTGASPTSVTVAGETYSIGAASAAWQLSTLGGGTVGNMVTLLLGMDDEVVGVVTGNEVDMMYYGVVQSSSRNVTDEGNAAVETAVTVICTDGAVRTFAVDQNVPYAAGRLVSVHISGSGVSMKGISGSSLDGRVDKNAEKLGSYYFADNVKILDTTGEGDAVAVAASRLAGCTLDSSDIRFYSLNEDNEIEHLILNDVTGDIWTYVYMTGIEDLSAGMSINVNYTYWLNGTETTLRSSGKAFPAETGGMAIRYESGGSVKSMRAMSSVKLTGLSAQTAMTTNKRYTLADDVQVYLRQDGACYLTSVPAVNADDYTLTGWYDTAGGAAGGLIRVIIATEK